MNEEKVNEDLSSQSSIIANANMNSITQSEEVTIPELLIQQSSLESEAAEVLPFNHSSCTRSLGPLRQSIYSCLTCNPPKKNQDLEKPIHQAGICASCSINCHTDHQLVELFIRRNFICDCGTKRCNEGKCELRLEEINLEERFEDSNKYDHNFDGEFCICERGKKYNPETETEDMYQCLSCEDWRHAGCLGGFPDPETWDDLICAKCVMGNSTIKTMMEKHAGGPGTGMMIGIPKEPNKTDSAIEWYGQFILSSSTENPEEKGSDQPKEDENSTSITSTSQTLQVPQKRNLSEDDKIESLEKRTCFEKPDNDHTSICTAPFQNRTDNLLSRANPSTVNVFLAAGWRQRWCKCLACFQSLNQISWLGSEEEEVWEPEDDQDSAKSLHELGMEAFKNLPQEHKIESLHAYNKLRDRMMRFLKPFAEKDLTVTEEDIKEFFSKEKEKIKKKEW